MRKKDSSSLEEEVRALRRMYFLRNIVGLIVASAVAIAAFIIGFLIGRSTDIGSGIGGGSYPFIPSVGYRASRGKFPRRWLALAGLAVLSFLAGLSPTVYGDTGVKYSVYVRK